jgi:hypothetical protein
MQQINRVVSWNTTKVSNGFKYEAYSFDYGIANTVHYSGIESTRAKASAKAKQAVRYLKSLQGK